ncbi:hypothetical protein FRB97_001383 [Tulasnella sp. 331]|nr:hypothetical protein FRB97_001383 [Tulasnella sp. 331]
MTTCLFVAATGNIVLSVYRAYEAFITYGKLPGGVEAFYNDFCSVNFVLKTVFFVFSITIAESILVWRLWTVWSRAWFVAMVPALLLTIQTGILAFLDYIFTMIASLSPMMVISHFTASLVSEAHNIELGKAQSNTPAPDGMAQHFDAGAASTTIAFQPRVFFRSDREEIRRLDGWTNETQASINQTVDEERGLGIR